MGDSAFLGGSAILKLLSSHQVRRHHSRIRSFASRPLERFAFVLEARLTDEVFITFATRSSAAAIRTSNRSLLPEPYDKNRLSQKTRVNETLSVVLFNRMFRL